MDVVKLQGKESNIGKVPKINQRYIFLKVSHVLSGTRMFCELIKIMKEQVAFTIS